MPISNDYTVDQYWREVCRTIGNPPNIPHFDQLFIANRSSVHVVGTFYDVLEPVFQRSAVITPSTVGAYYVAAGSWVASTLTLTATMNRNMTVNDIGCLVSFRIGAAIYTGQITDVPSVTSMKIDGDNLPSADGVVDYVLVAATTLTGDVADISSVRIARNGSTRLTLETTLFSTDSLVTTEILKLDELLVFNKTGRNAHKIAMSLSGTRAYFKKGDSLTSYGTVTLHYPGLPLLRTAGTEKMDIPDGPAMEIAIRYGAKLLRSRMEMPQIDDTQEIALMVQSMYAVLGNSVRAETIRQKVENLRG